MKMLRFMFAAAAVAALSINASAQKKEADPVGFLTYSLPSTTITLEVEAVQEKFPNNGRNARRVRGGKPQLSEKDRLIQKYHALEQDIVTYENNIGFFAMSKNSEPLIKQMQERIAQAKEELKSLAEQVKALNDAE